MMTVLFIIGPLGIVIVAHRVIKMEFGRIVSITGAALEGGTGLDPARVENLLMRQKAVALPYEDAITYGVNAANPLLETLADAAKDRIEMLITCSESGIDFGKSISTYMHHYLGLNRNCRLFELKQDCYAGTAGFQMDVGANGYYVYEVMDTCRPTPDGKAGDTDLSLLPYLHCCEQAFLEYQIEKHLNKRYQLSMDEYDAVLRGSSV